MKNWITSLFDRRKQEVVKRSSKRVHHWDSQGHQLQRQQAELQSTIRSRREERSTRPDSIEKKREERLGNRELLYSVIRDAMGNAGFVSASYKYKVLGLDASGLEFLIMIDLPDEVGNESFNSQQIEEAVAKTTNLQHDIMVKAIYWRSPHISFSIAPRSNVLRKQQEVLSKPAPLFSSGQIKEAPKTSPEPLLQHEMQAFQLAMRLGSHSSLSTAPRLHVVADKKPNAQVEFHETQIQEEAILDGDLSGTQYGALR